ncbi:MAG: hypothetical protein ABTQ34_06920 [Bdellovibrionales bacterium]
MTVQKNIKPKQNSRNLNEYNRLDRDGWHRWLLVNFNMCAGHWLNASRAFDLREVGICNADGEPQYFTESLVTLNGLLDDKGRQASHLGLHDYIIGADSGTVHPMTMSGVIYVVDQISAEKAYPALRVVMESRWTKVASALRVNVRGVFERRGLKLG